MAEKKIIAIVGATGAQGGGLARAILNDPSGAFAARALTRNVHSDKAKALAKEGADVVAADVDDSASLRRAFEDAHGAFCVTFFRAHSSVEKEIAELQTFDQWLERNKSRIPLE
ncbi:MAG: NmrA family NAD(P)-binding protein [Acidobacteriota bacterium]|nr:NmrA family NAD(P)-binding protein [Acidobacteriota bacterium]